MTQPMPVQMQTDRQVWQRVCDLMLSQCGVVLDADQSYLLAPRLGPITKKVGYATVAEFVSAAALAGPTHPLRRALVDAMTTHESSFFRDPTFWAALEEHVMPDLRKQGLDGLRIWSAACSHGQEVYSMAMLMEEAFPAVWARSTILATDVSEAAVMRAKEGVYTPLEVGRGIDARRLARHFDKVEGGHRVKPSLAKNIRFGLHNLMHPSPEPLPFHLVFCRNVLIYFNVNQRKATFERLCQATYAGGYIGLGTTEQGWRAQAAPGWWARGALTSGAKPTR